MLVAAGGVQVRAVALWCATTATAGGIAWIAAPSLVGGPGFTDLLVSGCAAVTLVAAGWLWAITTDVAIGLLKGTGCAVRRPGPVRLLLLAACGVVVLGATTTAASADDHRPVTPDSLSGLPLPDRATGAAAPPPAHHVAPVRVRPGDSLWAIAETRLGAGKHWRRIYARNIEVVGPDPDLILPGQLLELPPVDRGGPA